MCAFRPHCQTAVCARYVSLQAECKGWSKEIKEARSASGGNFFHVMYEQWPSTVVRMPLEVQQFLRDKYGVDPNATDQDNRSVPFIHMP